jgi:hypothetical protein
MHGTNCIAVIAKRCPRIRDRLVEEGSKLQKKTRKDVDGAVSDNPGGERHGRTAG